MKLGTKLLLALGVLFTLLTTADYAVQQHIVLERFERLEQSAARADLQRCQEGIYRELDHLFVKTRDWASWDDTYKFVLDRDEAYASSNLKSNAFEVSDFHVLYILNMQGDVVWGQVRDTDYQTPLQLRDFPPSRLPADHHLLHHRGTGGQEGEQAPVKSLMLTEHKPLLICALPILTSENEGPARGTLMMGRFLSDEAMQKLREQTRVDFDAYPVDATDNPPQVAAAMARMPTVEDVWVEAQNDKLAKVYGYLRDHHDQPAMLIEARISRDISAQGAATVRQTMIFLFIVAVLACTTVFLLLRAIVVRPLEQLTEKAIQIGRTGDLTKRVNIYRADEIGALGCEFDRMVGNLSDLRAKLVETSRAAGMADVASGVLHNVGNVLNSVNVSTTTLADGVRKSKVSGLARAAELLEKNRGNVADFITQDEHGRNLPTYICQLAQVLVDEQRGYLRELGNLKTSVDYVNQIVQSQQTFARRAGHLEPDCIRSIVSNSLAIMEPAFKRHGIEVHADLVATPTTLLDSAKLMQILVNLLTNAKDALASLPKREKRLAVRLRLEGEDSAVIDVSDNGVGIEPANLTRIFGNGFTAKRDGRGFGLHYSALAAKEIGGELTVQSDGPGRGACFTIRLPLRALTKVSAT